MPRQARLNVSGARHYLGEQMGSNGALSYMTAVAYSLVSVKGIDCVFFDIGEGEHASPGKYCKDSLEPLTPQ